MAQRMPRVAKVKNKQPAPQQITAEQILREAKERIEAEPKAPRQKITDPTELEEFKLKKRKEFEDQIRRNRQAIGTWLKYAKFEENLQEYARARSIYERALDQDHRNVTLYLRYAEMEMKHRNINHARNLFDRATTILPRIDQFWYKYTYMEEMLGNVAAARQAFERWMKWEPDEQAWHSYVKMELRYGEVARARQIYEKFVIVHPEVKNWIKYAKFETKQREPGLARGVYERAVEFFGEEHMDQQLFIAFAQFEEASKEYERARVIYKYALDRIPKEKAVDLFKAYTLFEKKHGDRAGIEDVLVSKRRLQYEDEVSANPLNYDAWFDFVRLEEAGGDFDRVRETYERAIANIPPAPEKRLWRRYIFLWVYYAVFEELVAEDMERTRAIFKACLNVIPHKKFTFAEIWLLYAKFELRQKNLANARKILGQALGMCPKDKLFKGYIELEMQLREFDRCRTLYEKFLEFNPANCTTWIKFAELETALGDVERARALYELAVDQPVLDMPEILWKAYIDFEAEQEEYENTRRLYRRLLKRSQHVKIWLSFARFEAALPGEKSAARARNVFEQADTHMKDNGHKEERVMVLEAWKDFEDTQGSEEWARQVGQKMPKKIKKRRLVDENVGPSAGYEEYYDYMFPDEKTAQPSLKLLQMAHMWKKMKTEGPKEGGEKEAEVQETGAAQEGEQDGGEES
eukprot:comp21226_c0_seq1/m.28880 comp21226_c0_seq1/g.28880  ORF comp21226_c0_seq1/g.28880 comp21226_c0_seq1/m.28880 type:complete len:692 (-) comp21226_c0_seq1:5-2080(-)